MKQVTCKLCGFTGYNLVSHLNRKHKISGAEYIAKFPGAKIAEFDKFDKDKISKAVKLAMNDEILRAHMSTMQRNGASRYTIKYWTTKGYSIDEAKSQISSIQSTESRKAVGSRINPTMLKYWMNKGHTELEATLKVKEIQSRNSSKSKKFKGKTNSSKTKEKIKMKMKSHINGVGTNVWANHFGDFSSGTSKLECEIFSYIKTNINNKAIQWKSIGNYIVDIAIDNKVIEVYGDFWHANPEIYSSDHIFPKILGENITSKIIWEKNAIRINNIILDGYDVLIIWERDWNKNKTEIINKINKFLSNDIKTKNS